MVIARGTPGFSPVPILLTWLTRQLCLLLVANKKLVTMGEFERAKDKIMMGAERKSMIMKDESEKEADGLP